ncbi:MAG: CinA family protein [Mariprofundaceae bacterium]|nr:CinA family protein [Mariprofundaceae bacterium]
MNSKDIALLLTQSLQAQGWKIRCVESCTAGALTAAIGQIAGVSSVLDRSWVTYSNQAKMEEVGVASSLLDAYGAVSQEVAEAMAVGAVLGCETDTLAVAVSGIAGPAGGSVDKPVGTIWLAIKAPHQVVSTRLLQLQGERTDIQQQAVAQALDFALDVTRSAAK